MSCSIACTGCGRADGLVAAYFVDRFKRPTGALACRYCGLVWPQGMSTRLAADVFSVMRDGGGPEIVEAAQ